MDQHSQDSVQTAYGMACERARQRSIRDEGCGIHVNAQVRKVNGLVFINDFVVEDWYVDGATVTTFINGEER